MKHLPSGKSLFSAFWTAFLPRNIVLVQAMGLCPILAIGIRLQYGVALAACTAAVLLPNNLLLSLVGEKVPPKFRPPLYVLLATGLLMLSAWVLQRYISPEIFAHLYMFLPLMAVNTLFTARATGSRGASVHPLLSVADTLGAAFGFGLVICVASALREMAIFGTLWGHSLGYAARFPEAEHPFIGYVLLGFMAATLQWLNRLSHRKPTEEVAKP